MRGTIARRMAASLRDSAQLTLHCTTDPEGLLAAHALARSQSSQRLSINDLFLFVVARTLSDHPALNATIDEAAVHRWTSINLGFAVALDEGLIVPVVRECRDRSLADMADATAVLVAKARAGGLAMTDVSDGTFTISNLGAFGVDYFTPIINPPQVAILGIGRASPQSIGLSLTIDHRAIDGATGGRFLSALSSAISTMEWSGDSISWR